MQHLSDEQLTALLYDETLLDPLDGAGHLDGCPDCAERFQQLELIKCDLGRLKIPDRECQVDVRKILDQESVLLKTTLGVKRLQGTPAAGKFAAYPYVMTASFLLLVGGLSFLMGVIYQKQTTQEMIQDQVAANTVEIRAIQENNSSPPLATTEFAKLRKSISKIKDWISEQPADRNFDHERAMLAVTDARLMDIIDEQEALRKDLQTLAINAEDEILLTKKKVMQINEFISNWLDSNPNNFQK